MCFCGNHYLFTFYNAQHCSILSKALWNPRVRIIFYNNSQKIDLRPSCHKTSDMSYIQPPNYLQFIFSLYNYVLFRSNNGIFAQLDLIKQFDEGDTTNYQTNGEFDLVSFEAIRHNQYYSCCVEPYPDITYVIKLRRRPMFYVFNLILPCLLINGIGKTVVWNNFHFYLCWLVFFIRCDIPILKL